MAKKFKPGKVVKKHKQGVIVANADGVTKTLLNPYGKGKKFARELKEGKRFTNDGKLKTTKSGKPKRLTDTQKSFRAGYLQARKDSAKAFKSNNK